jgi:hypothetical protein
LNSSVLDAQRLSQIGIIGAKIFGSLQGLVVIFAEIFDHSQIIVMSLPKPLKLFSGIFRILLNNLPFILTTLQGFRQFGYFLLKVKIRKLRESEIALEFFRFLRKLCVDLFLLNKPLSSNSPNQRRLKCISFLISHKLGRRI